MGKILNKIPKKKVYTDENAQGLCEAKKKTTLQEKKDSKGKNKL